MHAERVGLALLVVPELRPRFVTLALSEAVACRALDVLHVETFSNSREARRSRMRVPKD